MLLPEEVKENKNVFKVFINYTLWTFLIIFLLFVYIWQSIIVSDREDKIRKMEKQIIQFSKEKQKMETEISFLSSPQRIGKIAETEMKLVQLDQEDIIWINCKYNNSKKLAKKE